MNTFEHFVHLAVNKAVPYKSWSVRYEPQDYGRRIGAAIPNGNGEWFAVVFYENDTDDQFANTAQLLQDWLDGKYEAAKIGGRDTLTGSEHRAR